MRKNVLRVFSCFLAVVVLSLSVFPAQAVNTEYTSVESFWNWVAGSGDIAQGILSHIPIGSRDNVCAKSDDGYHHSNGFTKDGGDGYFLCVCRDCGREFRGYVSDLPPAYDNYVETLPAPSYASDGSLLYTLPTLDYFYVGGFRGEQQWVGCPHVPPETPDQDGYSLYPAQRFFNCDTGVVQTVPVSGSSSFGASGPYTYHFSGKAPVSGYYTLLAGPAVCAVSTYENGGQIKTRTDKEDYSKGTSYVYSQSADIICEFRSHSFGSFLKHSTANCAHPVYKVVPLDFVLEQVSNTYNITTRPTSITGGNYGIVGDNGQITKVEDNSTIINETNNTFYNPATGTTVPIVNWSYDYSDRSYKVTLESGDTATITYGDENITISQITTTEGDTITNNYTIYYLVDGSGSENPPSTCVHDWQETNTTPATCTVPGSKLSTCSKCQQTKTESLPALGHDWQVKQTVTTEYDDTGQLTQEGYTIFECSRCHEQYKSPGGGSGTDPGGEEEETIWDKLGKLLGTAVKALLDLLGSAVDVILGGLIGLITNLVESLKQLVDLFGTVGEAFQVLWTWLPPEITAILVAGVSIFVFVALLKFFMK